MERPGGGPFRFDDGGGFEKVLLLEVLAAAGLSPLLRPFSFSVSFVLVAC